MKLLRMKSKLPAAPIATSPHAAGSESGDSQLASPAVAALDSFIYRDTRWCSNCAGPQVFVEVFECDAGRVGVCMGCGEERVVRFTRTSSEVA